MIVQIENLRQILFAVFNGNEGYAVRDQVRIHRFGDIFRHLVGAGGKAERVQEASVAVGCELRVISGNRKLASRKSSVGSQRLTELDSERFVHD